MHQHLFAHIDIHPSNVHILNGLAPDLEAECAAFEALIAKHPIDFFLTGVGQNGHIAFNEPFTAPGTLTRIATLTPNTLQANARFFDGKVESVPKRALSVGIETIVRAKEIAVIATGEQKADAVRMAVEGPMGAKWPISWLQTHGKAMVVTDAAAAEKLEIGTVEYFRSLERAEEGVGKGVKAKL